jgi:hypothetical protein
MLLIAMLALGGELHADDDGPPKNLKVIRTMGRELQQAMNLISKGLTTKGCDVCHVKSDRASDDNPAKEHARVFLSAVVGEKDKTKREAALKALLSAIKLDQARDADKLWAGIDMLTKK